MGDLVRIVVWPEAVSDHGGADRSSGTCQHGDDFLLGAGWEVDGGSVDGDGDAAEETNVESSGTAEHSTPRGIVAIRARQSAGLASVEFGAAGVDASEEEQRSRRPVVGAAAKEEFA